MLTPQEHAEAILRRLPPRATVTLPLLDAANYTLATNLTAPFDSPRFDNSQMDGYALSSAQQQRTPGVFTVGPTVAAGADPDELYPEGLGDSVAPIMTGAKLPRGTTTIVPVEECQPDTFTDDEVHIPSVPQQQYVRKAGSDSAAGSLLLQAGTRLDALAIAALASQSITTVTVWQRPRVIICTGGAEISHGDGNEGVASIPDANGPMLHQLCRSAGIEVVDHIRTDDNVERFVEDVARGVDKHQPDAVITSGGISHGRYEVVRLAFAEHDAWFGHVAQQPGGPQGLATFRGTPVICLPGNPISTLVSFRLFVAPTLNRCDVGAYTARLTHAVTGLPDLRDQFLRGTYAVDAEGVLPATPIGGAGSHLLQQAVGATCLIRITARTHYHPGAAVQIYPLGELL